MNNRLFSFAVLLLILFLACKRNVKNDANGGTAGEIRHRVLTENLSFPWEILWGPDNMLWLTERGGRIIKINPSDGQLTPLLTISEVKAQGEGGLLGMVLHPDFKTTPHVFVAYNYDRNGDYRQKIVRYSYNGGTLTSPQTIFDNISAAGIHNGSRLVIANEKLFITTGDAADQTLPQNTSAVNGKILRLNLDGTIPPDNPIPGNPMWSYGHRNPQGLVFANGILYSSEHGPDTDDEINIIEKGRNFGWPDVRGYCNTNDEKTFCTTGAIKEPIHAWSPTVAACGLDFYNHSAIPNWKNSLLMVTLRGSQLIQLQLNNAHNAVTATGSYLKEQYGRLRDICVSPTGKVYICTGNGNNDKVIEIY
jgi:glucose/arabinose dehydrogenase